MDPSEMEVLLFRLQPSHTDSVKEKYSDGEKGTENDQMSEMCLRL